MSNLDQKEVEQCRKFDGSRSDMRRKLVETWSDMPTEARQKLVEHVTENWSKVNRNGSEATAFQVKEKATATLFHHHEHVAGTGG